MREWHLVLEALVDSDVAHASVLSLHPADWGRHRVPEGPLMDSTVLHLVAGQMPKGGEPSRWREWCEFLVATASSRIVSGSTSVLSFVRIEYLAVFIWAPGMRYRNASGPSVFVLLCCGTEIVVARQPTRRIRFGCHCHLAGRWIGHWGRLPLTSTGLPADRCPQPSRDDGVACGFEPGARDDGQGLCGGWREFPIHRHRASKRSCVLSSSSMGSLVSCMIFARFRFLRLCLCAS